ncbi:MAG: thiamine phosphate synthase [Candidatus Omnitrophica bacterium]|nr:thiamine phosphate synthase [Candidatus Omnitrophota bacterium]
MREHEKKVLFENFRLYAVTDLETPDSNILDKIQAVYAGGADIVQLRSKVLPDCVLYDLGLRFRQIADRYRKLFFVNDRVDIAIAVGADGLHVGRGDLPVAEIRRIAKKSGVFLRIGQSTHTVEQALEAQNEKVDYISIGPIYATPTKPNYPPVGLEVVREIAQRIKIPFVCIGGIDCVNVDAVLEAGGHRVAVVRSLFRAENVYEATKKLRKRIDSYPAAPAAFQPAAGRGGYCSH